MAVNPSPLERTQSDDKSSRNWRALHGGVYLAFLALLALGPPILLTWPWFWIAPLGGYFAVVALVPPLRRTFSWLRFGTIRWPAVAATTVIIVLTSAVLVLFQVIVRPDVRELGASLPVASLGGVVTAGIVFAVLNATLEELVFRGVLFDAIESQWNWLTAAFATAVLFGIGHRAGYPPGLVGAFLAGLYGFVLGLLRVWVGGLLLPIVAHVAADATIYVLLVQAGAI